MISKFRLRIIIPLLLVNLLINTINLLIDVRICGTEWNECSTYIAPFIWSSLVFFESLILFLITKKKLFTILCTTPLLSWLILSPISVMNNVRIYYSTRDPYYLQNLWPGNFEHLILSGARPLFFAIIAVYIGSYILKRFSTAKSKRL